MLCEIVTRITQADKDLGIQDYAAAVALQLAIEGDPRLRTVSASLEETWLSSAVSITLISAAAGGPDFKSPATGFGPSFDGAISFGLTGVARSTNGHFSNGEREKLTRSFQDRR